MYAAKIELGWVNEWFKGETPSDIIEEVEKTQDFDCLIRMGRRYETTKKGQKEIDKLEEFIEKYRSGELTIDDIKKLKIHLESGDIVCHAVETIKE